MKQLVGSVFVSFLLVASASQAGNDFYFGSAQVTCFRTASPKLVKQTLKGSDFIAAALTVSPEDAAASYTVVYSLAANRWVIVNRCSGVVINEFSNELSCAAAEAPNKLQSVCSHAIQNLSGLGTGRMLCDIKQTGAAQKASGQCSGNLTFAGGDCTMTLKVGKPFRAADDCPA